MSGRVLRPASTNTAVPNPEPRIPSPESRVPSPEPRVPRSHRPQLRLRQSHQPIEREADDANRDDREQDVRVDEAVVFLPEESADARRARQHLARDDDQPGDPKTESIAG